MSVWILSRIDHYEGDRTVTTWSDKASAEKQAIAELLEYVKDECDLSIEDAKDMAMRVNGLAFQGNYEAAMEEYEQCGDKYHYFGGLETPSWVIEESDLYDHRNVSPLIFLNFDTSNDEEIESTVQPSAYQPTSCGATCRGSCKSWNDYAWSDQPDGTYLCYSCKSGGTQ